VGRTAEGLAGIVQLMNNTVSHSRRSARRRRPTTNPVPAYVRGIPSAIWVDAIARQRIRSLSV
jgi:hypothetical protein